MSHSKNCTIGTKFGNGLESWGYCSDRLRAQDEARSEELNKLCGISPKEKKPLLERRDAYHRGPNRR